MLGSSAWSFFFISGQLAPRLGQCYVFFLTSFCGGFWACVCQVLLSFEEVSLFALLVLFFIVLSLPYWLLFFFSFRMYGADYVCLLAFRVLQW